MITIILILIPFAGFFLLGLGGKFFKARSAGFVGTAAMLVVTILSFLTALNYFGAGRNEQGVWAAQELLSVRWLNLTDLLHIDLGILLDPISVMMLLVISSISLMVHIYSLAYMRGERGFQRYYAFLALFTFSMLGLVVANNIFQMYLFWELVGVSSYLLIGFYYTKPSAIAAAKKAFIVTRFADFGFLVGILFYGYYGHTFGFSPEPMSAKELAMIPVALSLMFIGGAGKSALFPLHIWLPDAMEGPTPVSALIHAATMVVAGVYLVARMMPNFLLYGPELLEVIAWIAAFTSLFAALIACVQTDIKRVLAFSTISQIGFMFVALGMCSSNDIHTGGLGYMASMFHLFTHAVFKALLFLGAGSVIHAVHSNEMCDMGGLRRSMPITHFSFLVACLAIAGIPPLSGFFSKDEILTACFAHSTFMGLLMTFIAGMTAFYMFRLYFRIFWADRDYSPQKKVHESPFFMCFPLVLLALITLVAGFIPFGHFVTIDGMAYDIHLNMTVAVTSVIVASLSIALAAYFYAKNRRDIVVRNVECESVWYRALYNRFYIDNVYQFVTHRIIFRYVSQPLAWFDRHVIDGTLDGLASGTARLSWSIRRLQSGRIQQYALIFLYGLLFLMLLVLVLF